MKISRLNEFLIRLIEKGYEGQGVKSIGRNGRNEIRSNTIDYYRRDNAAVISEYEKMSRLDRFLFMMDDRINFFPILKSSIIENRKDIFDGILDDYFFELKDSRTQSDVSIENMMKDFKYIGNKYWDDLVKVMKDYSAHGNKVQDPKKYFGNDAKKISLFKRIF